VRVFGVSWTSLGLGSCFLGAAPYRAQEITEAYNLLERVFPLVQLAMGYPAENPPVSAAVSSGVYAL
jgi:nitroreductase